MEGKNTSRNKKETISSPDSSTSAECECNSPSAVVFSVERVVGAAVVVVCSVVLLVVVVVVGPAVVEGVGGRGLHRLQVSLQFSAMKSGCTTHSLSPAGSAIRAQYVDSSSSLQFSSVYSNAAELAVRSCLVNSGLAGQRPSHQRMQWKREARNQGTESFDENKQKRTGFWWYSGWSEMQTAELKLLGQAPQTREGVHPMSCEMHEHSPYGGSVTGTQNPQAFLHVLIMSSGIC